MTRVEDEGKEIRRNILAMFACEMHVSITLVK